MGRPDTRLTTADSSRRIQNQLRTAEQRDRPLPRLHHGIPHLRRPPGVHDRGVALDRTRPCGAQEVALELDGGESRRTVGQDRPYAVATRRVGDGDRWLK